MPTNTPNYNLVKPLVTENYDIAKVTNENADIIDDALHDLDVGKQPTLVSGTMIKTINSTDVLGSGNIAVQPTLVSGTNIKTINGNPILGSGDLVIESGDWKSISATLTYASAVSPTFVANTSIDLTSVISVGMKLKLTQTTVKYFIVTAITSTAITLYGGTDYTLANASITLPYFSGMSNPFGFPNTFNLGQVKFPSTQNSSTDVNTLDDYKEGSYTPTVTSSGGTITSYTATATYTKIGRLVNINVFVELTNAGSGSGSLIFTLPFTSQSNSVGSGKETELTGLMVVASCGSGGTTASIVKYDATTIIATGRKVRVSLSYDAL